MLSAKGIWKDSVSAVNLMVFGIYSDFSSLQLSLCQVFREQEINVETCQLLAQLYPPIKNKHNEKFIEQIVIVLVNATSRHHYEK